MCWLSLVAVSGAALPRGPLTVVASLAAEHGLQGLRAQSFSLPGSVVVVLGLSCSEACGIILDQGRNLCPLHWWADSLPLSHQGSLVLGFLTFDLMKRVSGSLGWQGYEV